MKAFVLLVLLLFVLVLIASSSLGSADLTGGASAQAAAPQVPVTGVDNPNVIQIQDTPVAGSQTVYQAPVISSAPAICTDPYIVRAGDTLSQISALCNTTFAAIRTANPDIANANLIYPGQQIRVPGAPPLNGSAAGSNGTATGGILVPQPTQIPVTGEQQVPGATPSVITTAPAGENAINPATGQPTAAPQSNLPLPAPVIPPGTGLQVKALNYPANTPVRVAIGPQTAGYTVVANGITDASGNLISTIVVPTAPDPSVPWVVVVATTGNPPVQAMSRSFYINANATNP